MLVLVLSCLPEKLEVQPPSLLQDAEKAAEVRKEASSQAGNNPSPPSLVDQAEQNEAGHGAQNDPSLIHSVA